MMTTLAGLVVVLSIRGETDQRPVRDHQIPVRTMSAAAAAFGLALVAALLYTVAQAQCPIRTRCCVRWGGTGASGAGRVCVPGGAPRHRPPRGSRRTAQPFRA